MAQSQRLQTGLQKLTGVTGMRAREALALMEQALEQEPKDVGTAVMTIAQSEGSFNRERLAVLRSPTYEVFVSAGRGLGEADEESIDLQVIASKDGVPAARGKAIDVITVQLANVLHLREEDISLVKPLGEIGLDSLMALELVMKLEERFGIRMPLTGASGGMTIADIADQIIAHVGLDHDRDDAVVANLAEQHHAEVKPAQLQALKEIMVEDVHAPKRLLS